MTIEEILAGESKNRRIQREPAGKMSSKYMKSVVAFANGTGGKSYFSELRIKPEKWLALTRKMYSKKDGCDCQCRLG